ncbi:MULTISPECIES: hypothetical protein [Clostridium]|uniref:hypothetical protein n=1 Tax=Clostridium TaxID=1485 RepID=UPI00069D194A|nr:MULTISPECIES: hypothetical protein [Clostridium]KOF55752.1 hypothetical protein AGR56_18210 [Clostridium sp. DMHC 10]MCD2348988.1 hypothetical protein [Clostridium guangxiense]
MGGGLNTRINNDIRKINNIIDENKLNLIKPVRFLNDEEDNIDVLNETYNEVIYKICEVIGSLKMFITPATPRADDKIAKYKKQIEELENTKIELEHLQKENCK